VQFPESDPLHAKKTSLARFLLGLPPVAHLDVYVDGAPCPALCAWLRIQNMTDEAHLTEMLRKAIVVSSKDVAKKLEADREKKRRYVEAVKRMLRAQQKPAEGGSDQSAEGNEAEAASGEAVGSEDGSKAQKKPRLMGLMRGMRLRHSWTLMQSGCSPRSWARKRRSC